MSDHENTPEESPEEKPKRTITEEIEVAGGQVIDQLKQIVREGNVRRVIVKTAGGRVLLDTTLALGAIGGGLVAAIGGLPLAALGAAVAIITQVKIEVVREVDADSPLVEEDDEDDSPIMGKQRIMISADDDEDDSADDAPETTNNLESDD